MSEKVTEVRFTERGGLVIQTRNTTTRGRRGMYFDMDPAEVRVLATLLIQAADQHGEDRTDVRIYDSTEESPDA